MMNDVAPLFDASPTELEAQYRAAAEAVVALDRSHLSRVAVLGSDREAFLNNMLSANVKSLAAGSGCEATFLTNKGKLVASFTVLRDVERFLMEMESERVEPLIAALSRYIISEDVCLETVDEASFSLEGPGASELASQLTGAHVGELTHLGFVTANSVRITARRHDPSPRFDLAAAPERALELLEAAREHGAVLGSAELAEARRIEAGRPRFGIDMDETRMPLEAGLDDAISFGKGCYIGQEYVVRLAHRGHLNQKLIGVRIDGGEPPKSKTPVMIGNEQVGALTSAAFSPKLGAVVALGYVKRESFAPGTIVTVEGRNGVVTALPFL